ncbi:MAG: amidohydrolase family protein [Pirellulaceae bacterium]
MKRMNRFRTSTMLWLGAILALINYDALLAQSQSTPTPRSTEPDVGIRFQPSETVALTNVTLDDGETAVDGVTLILEGERIVAVGTEVQIPADAKIVDCEGDYVYPAFVDSLVEFEAGEVPSNNAHWNSNVLAQRSMAELMTPDEDQVKQLRSAGIGTIVVAPSDGIIKGSSCIMTTGASGLEEELLVDSAFQHMRLFPTRRRGGGYPNSPMGAVALIRQTLSDANWYGEAKQAAIAQPGLSAPNYDAALEALQSVVDGTQTVVIDGSNELYAMRADRMAREFSLQLVIRGSGREYRRLDEMVASGRTFILPLDFPDAPELESEEQVADATLQELMEWKLAPSNPATLADAGIDFVFTADGLEKPADLFKAVRKAVDAGLSPTDALRALTSAPAELLGIDREVGSIKRGKLANLIRMDGPLFDKKSELVSTFVRGESFEFKADEENDLTGLWSLKLENLWVLEMELEVGGTLNKPSAAIGLAGALSDRDDDSDDGDKEEDESESEEASDFADFEKVSRTEYSLTGSFSVAGLLEDLAGTAFFSAAKIDGDSGVELLGNITWPDGSRSSFVAKPMSVEDSEDEVADEEDEEESDDEEDAGDSAAAEADSQSLEVVVNYPLGAFGVTASPEQPEWLVFRNATIWTSAAQGKLEDADLLIHAGKVQAVGVDLDVPEGCEVVDAEGLHISPGIIDCHTHMGTDGGVNESGQAITAEVRIGDFIDPNDITIYRHLAGGVTAANVLHGSANPIGGQNQVIKLRWGMNDEELKMKQAPGGIKFALGENVKQSNRSLENRTRYPQTRMGVEQIMRDRFEAAKLYRKQWSNWTNSPSGLPPRKDYELEAIAEILEGNRWIHCHSYRQDEILACMRVLDDYGITIGSFQHILEGYKVADAMAKHGAMGSSFSDWWAYKFEVYDAIPFNGALMHQAGIVVSFNSDDRELARHLNHEAAKAVKYGGVSETEALKFVTLNPAKQLRIEEWVGSLEPGKDADIAVWNKSPLSTMSACLQTWVDGRKYFDREQDVKAQAEVEALRMQLIQEIVDGGAKTGRRKDDDPSMWWARHDEFCHHFDDDHHDDHADHMHEMEGEDHE